MLIHPTRVAVTGRAESPGIFEVLELVGRDRVLARIDAARDAYAAILLALGRDADAANMLRALWAGANDPATRSGEISLTPGPRRR